MVADVLQHVVKSGHTQPLDALLTRLDTLIGAIVDGPIAEDKPPLTLRDLETLPFIDPEATARGY